MPVVLSLIGSDGFYTHLPDINETLMGILDDKLRSEHIRSFVSPRLLIGPGLEPVT